MVAVRLIDDIWATKKAEAFSGCKLMLAQVIGGARAGEQLVVVDTISVGIGDRVVITTGSSARRMLKDGEIPVDAVVAGIIDKDCTFDMEHAQNAPLKRQR